VTQTPTGPVRCVCEGVCVAGGCGGRGGRRRRELPRYGVKHWWYRKTEKKKKHGRRLSRRRRRSLSIHRADGSKSRSLAPLLQRSDAINGRPAGVSRGISPRARIALGPSWHSTRVRPHRKSRDLRRSTPVMSVHRISHISIRSPAAILL